MTLFLDWISVANAATILVPFALVMILKAFSAEPPSDDSSAGMQTALAEEWERKLLMWKKARASSFMDYTLVLGFVAASLWAMAPAIIRLLASPSIPAA